MSCVIKKIYTWKLNVISYNQDWVTQNKWLKSTYDGVDGSKMK